MNSVLQDHVCEVVAHTLGLNLMQVDRESSTQNTAAWTSRAHLRLIANLEQAFDVRFTMDEMATMNNVGAIERVLSARGIAE